MSIFLFCLAGCGACYYAGLRTPGRGRGTPKGWAFALSIGVLLGLLYWIYSAYGLMFSLESLFD